MRKTQRALKTFGVNMDAELQDVVRKTADEILEVAKKSISRRSRGAKRGKRVSSAPSKPPNNQSGELLASLKSVHKGMQSDVEADKFYASFLELGTKDIAAHPFMRPAMKRRRFAWNKRLREVSKKAAAKAGRTQ